MTPLKNNILVRDWDDENLSNWMENIPISSESISVVADNNVSAIQLIYFDSHDLKNLGMKSADAKKLFNEINQLRKLQEK